MNDIWIIWSNLNFGSEYFLISVDIYGILVQIFPQIIKLLEVSKQIQIHGRGLSDLNYVVLVVVVFVVAV